MQTFPQGTGWIEVICGPMFSGKTEELLRRVRQVMAAKQGVQLFKPLLDNRYHSLAIVSHLQRQLPAEALASVNELPAKLVAGTRVVAIDEGQFFGVDLVAICSQLADMGLRVIVAGLDQDYQGFPFQPIPELMAHAEFVSKILAICTQCGNPAGRSQRLGGSKERILVGATADYEPRCRRCHQRPSAKDVLPAAAIPAQPVPTNGVRRTIN